MTTLEFEYWQFVVMTIGYWEKELPIYAIPEDSITFYDCEDMIIFIRSNKEAKCVQRAKG